MYIHANRNRQSQFNRIGHKGRWLITEIQIQTLGRPGKIHMQNFPSSKLPKYSNYFAELSWFTLIRMRGDTFISLSCLDQTLSAEFKSKYFWRCKLTSIGLIWHPSCHCSCQLGLNNSKIRETMCHTVYPTMCCRLRESPQITWHFVVRTMSWRHPDWTGSNNLQA